MDREPTRAIRRLSARRPMTGWSARWTREVSSLWRKRRGRRAVASPPVAMRTAGTTARERKGPSSEPARGSGAAEHRSEGVQGHALARLDRLEAAEHGLLVFRLELDRRASIVHAYREARAISELGLCDDLSLQDPGASFWSLHDSTLPFEVRPCVTSLSRRRLSLEPARQSTTRTPSAAMSSGRPRT